MLNTSKWSLARTKENEQDRKRTTGRLSRRGRRSSKLNSSRSKRDKALLAISEVMEAMLAAAPVSWVALFRWAPSEGGKDLKAATWASRSWESTKACSKRSARRRSKPPSMNRYQRFGKNLNCMRASKTEASSRLELETWYMSTQSKFVDD